MEALSNNAPALLRQLTRSGGATRLELQKTLDVSGPTITRTILELSDLGIIQGATNATGGKGRPAEIVSLAGNGLCAIAVSIRAERVLVNLVDARGHQVDSYRLPVSERTDYSEAVATIGRAVLEIAGQAAVRFRCLAGVGISFGGSADYASGAITMPSAFQSWRGKPLARDLEFYTGLPCAIENYSFALVGALNWFDAGRQPDFFLVVADYGIAGVSSIRDNAYLGHGRSPGGFGHTGSRVAGKNPCHCGGYDCLDALWSLRAIYRRAEETGFAAADAARNLAELVRNLDASDVAGARSLVDEASERIAEGALALCRGMGFASCVFGGVLFDFSPRARRVAEEVFAASVYRCTPRFLTTVFETRSPDDLAATAVAYDFLSDKRQVFMLDSQSNREAVRLRQL